MPFPPNQFSRVHPGVKLVAGVEGQVHGRAYERPCLDRVWTDFLSVLPRSSILCGPRTIAPPIGSFPVRFVRFDARKEEDRVFARVKWLRPWCNLHIGDIDDVLAPRWRTWKRHKRRKRSSSHVLRRGKSCQACKIQPARGWTYVRHASALPR